MTSTRNTTPARARQTRQQFVNPEDYLSYELGKAVRQLPPLYTRLLAGSISMVIFSTLTWAYFSKIDEVAVANGELIPSAQVRPVRALEGGVIDEILVREGDVVEQGDVLIVQDPKLNQAEVDRLRESAALIRQDIARYEAELNGSTTTGTALQDELLAARLQEFDTRQAAAQAEAQRLAAGVSEARAELNRLQASLPNARELLANARDREESLRSLVDGAIPRFDYLEAKDRLTEAEDRLESIQRQIEVQQQSIRQAEQAYEAAQKQSDRLASERRSEILTQLNQRREELANLEGQLNQATIRAEGQTITAPISGRIYNVQATLAEKTIEPGEELLSILPQDETLLLEVKVLNRDIGFIQEGMRAKVKVATFPFQEFGTLDGTVAQISPNAVVDENLGPVFLTQIRLEQIEMPVGEQTVELVPGMAATGEIVTRQKSVLTFLLEPITRRFSDAFSVR
ncbi:MAG: HlyD family type I secretion periplasmic adaptor subunit [Elainellaceae cyanobacterium]